MAGNILRTGGMLLPLQLFFVKGDLWWLYLIIMLKNVFWGQAFIGIGHTLHAQGETLLRTHSTPSLEN